MSGAARPYIVEVLEKGEDLGGDASCVHQHPAMMSTHNIAAHAARSILPVRYAPGTLAEVAGGNSTPDPYTPCLNTDWPPVTPICAVLGGTAVCLEAPVCWMVVVLSSRLPFLPRPVSFLVGF
jgi:hypothetical protein